MKAPRVRTAVLLVLRVPSAPGSLELRYHRLVVHRWREHRQACQRLEVQRYVRADGTPTTEVAAWLDVPLEEAIDLLAQDAPGHTVALAALPPHHLAASGDVATLLDGRVAYRSAAADRWLVGESGSTYGGA